MPRTPFISSMTARRVLGTTTFIYAMYLSFFSLVGTSSSMRSRSEGLSGLTSAVKNEPLEAVVMSRLRARRQKLWNKAFLMD